MKVKTKKRLLRALTTAVSAALVSSVALGYVNDAFGGGTAMAQALMTYSGTLTDVTGSASVDGIRDKYLNKNVVTENTLKDTDERWIIVGFDGNSVIDDYKEEKSDLPFSEYVNTKAAKRRVQDIEGEHNDFLSKLDKAGIDYEFKYSYSTLNNGVAIKVQRKDAKKISKWKEVADVTYSESYAFPKEAVSNNANVYTTGIYNTQGINYTGAGMKVAVLDTGLDFTHDAFVNEPENKEIIWHPSDVTGILDQTEAYKRSNGLTVDQVYYNAKVPFAYDYADNDPDVYPSYSNHGTHVAAIVSGRDDGKVVNVETEEKFVGVAPESQLVICKVFTDNLDSDMIGGADTVDILAALADCATLGVDVINMSLGSSCGFSEEGGKEVGGFVVDEVYGKIEELGISLVVAASNDYSSGFGGGYGTNLATNPDSATVGAPGTYSSSLTVASINGKEATYMVANQKDEADESNVAFITEASDANGNELDFMEQLYEKTKTPKTEKLVLNYVVIGGVGQPANYTSSVKKELSKGNTIALVKRGDTTFAEKVENAMNEGALACIIYNNVSGTIRMSLGEVENPIPTCSIGMDAGKMLVDTAKRNVGTVTFSYNYKAGPFMSEFSSWGPTPDLKLKPEITAHGGEITSAVPGGYDELSGTSMASPNMAGAITLLRQHVAKTYGLSGYALNAMVNQLAMSTTTMALNEEGNPYSPRKQGSGLARIKEAIQTEGYLTVKDDKGNVSNKTKIELGDDDDRTGVYTLEFTLNNLSTKPLTYKPNVYVMTETLATDLRSVAEKAYMLKDSDIQMTVGGQKAAYGSNVTVDAKGTLDISIQITLGEEGRNYLEDSFKNGMFVEGFVRMQPVENATVDLGVPFLGFYGDWADAPLFDYSMYELAVTDADPSIKDEDKPKASASATTPFGLYDDEQYIIPLGSYLYLMDEEDTEVYPSTDKAVISAYDTEGRRTMYEFYMVYAGLLRGAKTLQVDVENKTTGELIYSQLEKNVRKSYAGGGGNYGAPVSVEIAPLEWELSNNTTYTMKMKGTLDCEGGENPNNNEFTFDFTVDTESPVIRDYRIRFEPYTENKETKYRIYMDVDVYDNQYTMSVQPCYIREERDERYLTLLSDYPIPTYSQKGTEKTISFEVTDYYEEYILTGEFHLVIDDYALNQTTYVVNAPKATDYPDAVTFKTDDKLTLKSENVTTDNANGVPYNVYELSLAANEVYATAIDSAISGELQQALVWRTDNDGVLAKESELFAVKNGSTIVNVCKAYNSGEREEENTYTILAQIVVNVGGTALDTPTADSIGFAPVLVGAYNLVDPDSGMELEFHPNDSIQFKVESDPWYVPLELEWSSSNPNIFTVDQNGLVTTKKKGSAYLEVSAKGYSRLKKSVKLIVGEELNIISYRLYDYYGGPEVIIPEDKNVMYIDKECFQYNTEITKVVLPETLLEISEEAFRGCTSLKEVVIPASCPVVNNLAFYGCTSLEKIVLNKMKDDVTGELDIGAVTLGRSAFEGCKKLTTIENAQRITTAYTRAFADCISLESIDLTELRITSASVFSGCKNLKTVITGPNTAIGEYMFNGCEKLTSFDIKTSRLSQGAFMNCTALEEVTFSAPILYNMGVYAFYNTAVEEITLPNGSYELGDNFFSGNKALRKVTLSENTKLTFSGTPFEGCSAFTEIVVPANNPYHAVENGLLLNKDKNALQLIPYGRTEAVAIPDGVTEIGAGVFAGASITEIDLNNVTKIGDYAFANTLLATIDLSKVTEIGGYAFERTELTEVDLTGIQVIGEGAFADCRALSKLIGTESVLEIGEGAFKNCESISSLTFENLTHVGKNAFIGSTLKYFTAPKLTVIGDYAFAQTALREADFPCVTSIGYKAFYNDLALERAVFGGVVEMGDDAFMIESDNASSLGKLKEVIFGEGTEVVGNSAFVIKQMAEGQHTGWFYRTSLTKVSLPSTLKRVGDYAFAFAPALADLALGSVEEIGEWAFYATESFTTADLSSAKKIGTLAFGESGIQTVKLGEYEQIGTMAFALTNLTAIEIPNMQTLTFDDSWWEVDDGGNDILVTGKKTSRLQAGAFGGMNSLKTVSVKGEGKLQVIDGVLYANTNEGLVIMLYPAAKAGSEYTVAKNTVRIDDYAFYNVANLQKVTLPYTVKAIGSYAFYHETDGKGVSNFVFEGVEAPILEASYHENGFSTYEVVDENGETQIYLTEFCGWDMGMYYSNFRGFIHETMDCGTLKPATDGKDFALSITYPQNGIGYNSPIWNCYFSTKATSEYAAEYVTMKTIEAIAALPTLAEVEGAATYEEVKALSENFAQPARKLYNQITATVQRALVTEYDSLLAAEKAIRDKKASLGKAAEITAFEIVKNPTKIKYVGGELFDGTGMVLKVVYDDNSEHEVTSYTADKEILYSTGDINPVVDITLSYEGKTCVLSVIVEGGLTGPETDSSTDSSSSSSSSGGKKKGCGNVVGGTLAFAGLGVALLLKKGKERNGEQGNEK